MRHDSSLLVPFLDESPAFAHGVEIGVLFQRMRHGSERSIDDLFLIDNQEQVHLMAARLGWRVLSSEPIETPGWVRIRMRHE